MKYKKKGIYALYIKRMLDVGCSIIIILLFWWLYIIIAVLVRIKLGTPILFLQHRPGMINRKTGKETIFCLYKFRTMTNDRDADGRLLPDQDRLRPFGVWLRRTRYCFLSKKKVLYAFCWL